MHVEELIVEILPAEHIIGCPEPWVQKCPAGHGTHSVDAAPEYVPAGQETHVSKPETE